MKKNITIKKNFITDNKDLESNPIKPFNKAGPESKLSDVTLNNSDIDLCQESKLVNDIYKSNSTIIFSSKNSISNIPKTLNKKISKDSIKIEEKENTNTPNKTLSEIKKEKITSSLSLTSQDTKKKLKNDRSSHLYSEKNSTSLQKIQKPSPPINSSLKSRQRISSTNTSSKNSVNPLTSTETKVTISNNNNNNDNSNNHFHSTNSSSSQHRKMNINNSLSLKENKKTSYKSSNPTRNTPPLNKTLSQNSKKSVKTDIRKNISSQSDSTNHIERYKQNDYTINRNSSQLRLKKPLIPQTENSINEKDIVLKSNEYRKAIAKINSLEKTIKQLQTQHSETLSCLHSEIERLQKACSEKTLSEAFKGTGLLTSLSENNIIHKSTNLEKVDSLNTSNDNTDQDILIQALNNIPKGMNLLPKIKKQIDDNTNIEELPSSKNNQESSDMPSLIEDVKFLNNSSNIEKIKSSNTTELNDKINNFKKKTSGNIRAHKYHVIEKPNPNTNEVEEYPKPSLSEGNLISESMGSHKQPQSFVSLSEASTAVALSSDHASFSSLMKSDTALKESKSDFINNIKTNSKLAISLNRQLPPPIPPNYSRSNKISESPRRIINLPKILQPIVKIKETKNTSINLPSLIKNKTVKK